MSDDTEASGAQRDDQPGEETGLVTGQDAQAPSDVAGGTAGADGRADSAFVVLKERSETSLKTFILTFAVVNLILVVRVQQPVVRLGRYLLTARL